MGAFTLYNRTHVRTHANELETLRELSFQTHQKVIIEVGAQGGDEFLGRVVARPSCFVLDPTDAERPRPYLRWYELRRGNRPAGEILAAFELVLLDQLVSDTLSVRAFQQYSS